MPKTFTAPFIQKQRTEIAVCTAATGNYNTDAPTNVVLLCNAGADDSIITNLSAIPRNTVSQTSLMLFISKDGGTTKRLIDSEVMQSYSWNTTTAVPETMFARYTEMTPLRLGAGESLWVGVQVAPNTGGIVFKAEIGDF
jgi:hypothetical protein